MNCIIRERVDGISLDEFLPKRKDLKIIIECPKCGNLRQSNSYDVLTKNSTLCIKCCNNKPKKGYGYRKSSKYRQSMSESLKNSKAYKDSTHKRAKAIKKYWKENRGGFELSEIYTEWELYKKIVYKIMEVNYKKYKKIINPKKLKRGKKDYHIDHRFSVLEGFKNNILPYIISHPFNLEMKYYKDNLSKDYKCSITKKQLMEGVHGT